MGQKLVTVYRRALDICQPHNHCSGDNLLDGLMKRSWRLKLVGGVSWLTIYHMTALYHFIVERSIALGLYQLLFISTEFHHSLKRFFSPI